MEKYIKRVIENRIKKILETDYAVAILGARQTGKTTLMSKIKAESLSYGVKSERVFLFNFDDVLLRSRVTADFYFLVKEIERSLGEELPTISEPILLCVDEAQKVPDVFELLKIIFDRQRRLVKILLTGSSSLDIRKKSAESLAGRIQYFYLYPLSISEILQEQFSFPVKHNLFSQLGEGKAEFATMKKQQAQIYKGLGQQRPLELILERLLVDGGLPAVWQRTQEKELVYKTMVETYLEKDIHSLGEVGDMADFTQLLRTTADEIGGLLNVSELSKAAGVVINTLKKYYSIMQESFVLNKLTPLVSQRKRFVKSPKMYFFDVGVANYLAHREKLEHLRSSGMAGLLFENMLLKSFESFNRNQMRPLQLFFWRDYQGHEVDFVLEKGKQKIPVEATLAKEVSQSKLRNLRHFFENFPEAEFGIIVYTGELDKITVENRPIYLVPWWLWW